MKNDRKEQRERLVQRIGETQRSLATLRDYAQTQGMNEGVRFQIRRAEQELSDRTAELKRFDDEETKE
jgi:hypothetical protein